MGLYIKGLQLPKKGRYTSFTVYSDGRAVYKFGGDHAGQAIEVPAHGDLIERNELLNHRFVAVVDKAERNYVVGWNTALEAVAENAPTVIPAEEET